MRIDRGTRRIERAADKLDWPGVRRLTSSIARHAADLEATAPPAPVRRYLLEMRWGDADEWHCPGPRSRCIYPSKVAAHDAISRMVDLTMYRDAYWRVTEIAP